MHEIQLRKMHEKQGNVTQLNEKETWKMHECAMQLVYNWSEIQQK